ncbi:MAG: hypothetical protein V3V75_02470 [Thermoguttaceae bacterium]
MKETMYRVRIAASSHWGRILGIVICCLATEAMAASNILETSGVNGGLVVVVGCEDTTLITELGQSEKFLVQALDTDPAKVEKAREVIRKSGNYGRVSATLCGGKTLL